MLDREMEQVLQNLSFHALLMCLSKLLNRMGFGDVEVMGRRTTRQRSHLGGFDLDLRQPIPFFSARTLVKVIQDDIRLRMFDELSGAITRVGAEFGLVISPFRITGQAAKYQAEMLSLSIRLIDGKELAKLMVTHRVGVVRAAGKDRIDYSYFKGLEGYSNRVLEFVAKLKREDRHAA